MDKGMTIQQIQSLLDKQSLCIGSVINVRDIEDNKVIVKLSGTCSGCPGAQITVKESIETVITEKFPFIEEVILETSVDDELLAFAKQLLNHGKLVST